MYRKMLAEMFFESVNAAGHIHRLNAEAIKTAVRPHFVIRRKKNEYVNIMLMELSEIENMHLIGLELAYTDNSRALEDIPHSACSEILRDNRLAMQQKDARRQIQEESEFSLPNTNN